MFSSRLRRSLKQDLSSGGAAEASNHLYIGWKGPRLSDVVKTLRAPEAIGGWAHIALFERTWGLHAYAAPSHRVETGGGGVYPLDRRGRKCVLEGCVAEARATGGFCLNRHSAYTPWSPWRLPSAA